MKLNIIIALVYVASCAHVIQAANSKSSKIVKKRKTKASKETSTRDVMVSDEMLQSDTDPDLEVCYVFSNQADSNMPGGDFDLFGGAIIITDDIFPDGVLRIAADGQYAKISGVDIGPSSMNDATLMIGFKLNSIPGNSKGWIFGHEDVQWDRSIILHDERYGKTLTAATGINAGETTTKDLWNLGNGVVPVDEWVHATAVFRQGGDSYVFLNGMRSDLVTLGSNNAGLPDLYVGRPLGRDEHWADAFIREVKVYSKALTDDEVISHSTRFLKAAKKSKGSKSGKKR